MSLNITIATWASVICLTDRRLTKADGAIRSERSTKLTAFDLLNGVRGFITYNGIGCDDRGVTPNDWIADLSLTEGMSYTALIELIKAETDPKIRAVSDQFQGNPRHTFVIGAFVSGRPVVSILSNYECGGEPRAKALPALETESWVARPEAQGAMIITGAAVPRSKQLRLYEKLKSGAPNELIIARARKLMRDASYGKERSGAVGSSIMIGQWPQFGAGASQLNVVGGTSIAEAPNFITPRAKWADIHFGGATERQRRMEAGEEVSHIEFGIGENPCRQCGNPVPEGYRKCGVCGVDQPPTTKI